MVCCLLFFWIDGLVFSTLIFYSYLVIAILSFIKMNFMTFYRNLSCFLLLYLSDLSVFRELSCHILDFIKHLFFDLYFLSRQEHCSFFQNCCSLHLVFFWMNYIAILLLQIVTHSYCSSWLLAIHLLLIDLL